MRFLTNVHTDIGTRKKTNQDSMLVMQAQSSLGPVLLAAVCDGMGGLAKGEVASAVLTRAFQGWFANTLPWLISGGFSAESLKAELSKLVVDTGRKIAEYGAQCHVELGTTAVVLLIVGDRYLTLNVGDSRVYLISDAAYQLTKDQTYVQREIDAGRMTPQQAEVDPQKNVLLQCVGASNVVVPDFTEGTVYQGQVFMLCCDGFRHVVQPQEFHQYLNSAVLHTKEDMERSSAALTSLNISRGETDNISVVLVKTEE